MTEARGSIYFWNDADYITGYMIVGDEHYELVGVKRSDIRTDFEGRQIVLGGVDDSSSSGARQRDLFGSEEGRPLATTKR